MPKIEMKDGTWDGGEWTPAVPNKKPLYPKVTTPPAKKHKKTPAIPEIVGKELTDSEKYQEACDAHYKIKQISKKLIELRRELYRLTLKRNRMLERNSLL